MFLLPFLLNKAILIGLSLVVVGTATVYGGIKAVEYRDTQISLQEAKQLSSEGKYQEAINKLNTTENKWSTEGVKKEIKIAIENNKQLIGSSNNYDLGKEMFDKGNYKDALELLKKIDSRNINYPSALSLIELAEKKITDTLKGEVIEVKTIPKKVTQSIPQASPTPTQTPILTPTPTLTPQPAITQHSDSYCKNEAKLAVIRLDEKLSKITHEESPWLFSYDAYLKQFPGADIGYDAWQQFARQTYNSYNEMAVQDAEKLYYQVYNQCLGQ